jgi:hypothetical protein
MRTKLPQTVEIQIENPRQWVGVQPAGERVKFGSPADYKPCVAKLPDERLVLTAFAPGAFEAGPHLKQREEILLFRSQDGGRTWSDAENLTITRGLLGREPYFTILSDGTVLMTVHFLINDVRNDTGYCRSFVHRSADGGETWETTAVEAPGMKPGESSCTTRNVLELKDGSLLVGVSAPGAGRNIIWRSRDGGKTWDETYPSTIEGLDDGYPHGFFGEGYWWQAASGKTYLVQRLDGKYCTEKFGDDAGLIAEDSDQYDRLVVFETSDLGRTLSPVSTLGELGNMYPSILRLQDGRLLFTFTVRTGRTPLGIRSVLGEETHDGFHFDCAHDRFLLDPQTAPDVTSGGGFGPTVQLDDGTLVTSYSWRDAGNVTHLEVMRWHVPAG